MSVIINYIESACKDAPCIAQSRVTQKIFDVLVEWYHHIVLKKRAVPLRSVGGVLISQTLAVEPVGG